MQLYPPFILHIFFIIATQVECNVCLCRRIICDCTQRRNTIFSILSLSLLHIPSVERVCSVFSYSNEFFFLFILVCVVLPFEFASRFFFFILARPRRVVHATLNGCIECVSVNSLTHFCLSFSVPLALCSVGLGVTLRGTSYVWVCVRVTRVHNCGCDPPLGQLDECIAIFSPVIIQSTDMYNSLCISHRHLMYAILSIETLRAEVTQN